MPGGGWRLDRLEEDAQMVVKDMQRDRVRVPLKILQCKRDGLFSLIHVKASKFGLRRNSQTCISRSTVDADCPDRASL
jgi:hypothetical protein